MVGEGRVWVLRRSQANASVCTVMSRVKRIMETGEVGSFVAWRPVGVLLVQVMSTK